MNPTNVSNGTAEGEPATVAESSNRISSRDGAHGPTTPDVRVSIPPPLPKEDGIDTHQKALRINLDPAKYGTFAEIGAGQEVARWFFRVGGASKTIAKTISAYDMLVSDAIYGHTDRYVSRQRLTAMVEDEVKLLL